jgi:hypothetical protein
MQWHALHQISSRDVRSKKRKLRACLEYFFTSPKTGKKFVTEITLQHHNTFASRAGGALGRRGAFTDSTVFVRPQRKVSELANKKQLKLTVFIQPRSERFRNWQTEPTQLTVFVQPRCEQLCNRRTKQLKWTCICSAEQRKIVQLANKSNSAVQRKVLELAHKKQLKLTTFVQPRSKRF